MGEKAVFRIWLVLAIMCAVATLITLALFIGTGIGAVMIAFTDDDLETPFYIYTASVVMGILAALCMTALVVTSLNAFQLSKKQTPLAAHKESAPSTTNKDARDPLPLRTFQQKKLKKLTKRRIVVIFLGLLGIIVAVMLVFGALTLLHSVDAIFAASTPLWMFVVVDLTLGLVVPFVFVVSLLFLTIVIRFITYHKVDPRRIIPLLLPAVNIVSHYGRSYWCIADRFYYFMDIESQFYRKNLKTEQARLHKRLTVSRAPKNEAGLKELNSSSNESMADTDTKHDQKYIKLEEIPSCKDASSPHTVASHKLSLPHASSLKHMYQEKESLATWLIYGMLAIVFMISCGYFVNEVVISERTITFCSELTNQERTAAYCYSNIISSPINLTGCETVNYGVLYCIVINDINEGDTIDDLANSVVLFYITGVIISIAFHAVKFLNNFYTSNIWSIAIITIGMVLLLTCVSVLILIYFVDAHLNILMLLKLTSMSINIVVAGVLLLIGVHLEKEEEEDEDSKEKEVENALEEVHT